MKPCGQSGPVLRRVDTQASTEDLRRSTLLKPPYLAIVLAVLAMSVLAASDAIADPAENVDRELDSGSIAPAPSASEDLTLNIVSLLPSHVSVEQAAETLSISMGTPVILEGPESLLLTALQWAAPFPPQAGCAEEISRAREELTGLQGGPPSDSATGVVNALVKSADNLNREFKNENALERLDMARALLRCAEDILPAATLEALYLQEAIAHLTLLDGLHRPACRDVLAVEPQVVMDSSLSPEFRNDFLNLAAGLADVAPLPVEIERGEGDLILNGRLVSEGPEMAIQPARLGPGSTALGIRPGRLLVQARNPFGQVRTRLLEVTDENRPLRPLEMAGLASPGDDVLAELALTMTAGELTSTQRQGLDRYLEQRGVEVLFFAIQEFGRETPTLRVYRREKGLLEADRVQPAVDQRIASTGIGSGARAVPTSQADSERHGFGFDAQLRIGGAQLVLADTSPTRGFVVDLSLLKRLGTRLQLGAWATLHTENAAGYGPYPRLEAGVFSGLEIPIVRQLAFVPAAGYGFGGAPPVMCRCSSVVNKTEAQDLLACSPGLSEDGTASLLAGASGHGPLARAELVWRPAASRTADSREDVHRDAGRFSQQQGGWVSQHEAEWVSQREAEWVSQHEAEWVSQHEAEWVSQREAPQVSQQEAGGFSVSLAVQGRYYFARLSGEGVAEAAEYSIAYRIDEDRFRSLEVALLLGTAWRF